MKAGPLAPNEVGMIAQNVEKGERRKEVKGGVGVENGTCELLLVAKLLDQYAKRS